MKLTKEQKVKAKKQFENDIKDVDNNDIEYASKKGNSKIDKFGDNPPSALIKIWKDIKVMINLVTDYAKGDYKEVSWNIIASITGAVIYFISPIDVIPDFIPVAGYLDDGLVIKLALDIAMEELEKYKEWKNNVDI